MDELIVWMVGGVSIEVAGDEASRNPTVSDARGDVNYATREADCQIG